MSSSTSIHFLRHGDIENPKDIFYGRLPGFPLSEDGQERITFIAHKLQNYPISAIYASPLLRTKQTAEIVSQAIGQPVITDDRLLEVATTYEGLPRQEILNFADSVRYQEKMEEVYTRMASFLRDKVAAHPDTHIVAVSHRACIRILTMGLLNYPFTQWAYAREEGPTCGSDTLVTVEGDSIQVKPLELV